MALEIADEESTKRAMVSSDATRPPSPLERMARAKDAAAAKKIRKPADGSRKRCLYLRARDSVAESLSGVESEDEVDDN